ncbi:unnamed protein product [Soboliphyme baturini]|uniref:Galactose-1-phosphate uridylyltransferase n=1 Tax=Soboliphyme baturini TaxID=241478 RepID=A0A183J5Q2_9BILA|nr:unnamed protein product [Soboliphyme baturini]
MMNFPHRRYNPLLDQWIIVSPQRLQRPWLGGTESAKKMPSDGAVLDLLAAGAIRSSGKRNENYEQTFVFENDFPALGGCPADWRFDDDHPLFRTSHSKGVCKVMCFHRSCQSQMALMSDAELLNVVECWMNEQRQLEAAFQWVQIFENKGEIMGCSNPHPHCQIWAYRGVSMLEDYVFQEIQRKERIVVENSHWLCLVPFWAVWPYETMLLPKRHVLRLSELLPEEVTALSKIIRTLLIKYDNLFSCSFPYSMAWYSAPAGDFLKEDLAHWYLHAVYLPPLVRSATVKKFMAGFEMVCEPQRDLTPENAAKVLRSLPVEHYTISSSDKQNDGDI